MPRHGRLGFGLLLVALGLSRSAVGATSPPDTLAHLTLPPVIVTTDALGADSLRLALGRITELPSRPLRERAEPSVAAVAALLPSTRLGLNSRGEAQFMLRGASERHLRVSRDGIPLGLAWDERSDLSLIPAEALGGLTVHRGVVTLLDGPGALAGSLELHVRPAPRVGSETQLDLGLGELGARRAALFHGRHLGPWGITLALADQRRNGWLLPAESAEEYNQDPARRRSNSDLARSSGQFTLDRSIGGRGELRLSLAANRAEKGVPPETHRENARFWRYPDSRRLLAGLALDWGLDSGGRWRFETRLASDLADQEIRVFDGADYAGPALAAGVPWEQDRDRTLHAGLGLRGMLGRTRLALDARLRDARHRERLVVDGSEASYRQRLSALTLETDIGLGPGWWLRTGLSWLNADTPASGPWPARAADSALDWLVALERRNEPLGGRVALSRRARFPALRELYSGALGQFTPNPELEPERQDLFEAHFDARWQRLRASAGVFASYLEGGIEKRSLPDGIFERVNSDAIRALGIEGELALALPLDLELSGHWLQLGARREEDGAYNAPVEDRPDHQGLLALRWERGGWRCAVEAERIGPRHSADSGDAEDGLRELPGQGRVNLQTAYRRYLGDGRLRDAELRLRLDNLGDALLLSQTGLPEPGRRLSAALRLGLGL